MHPGMIGWWKSRRDGSCGGRGDHDPSGAWAGGGPGDCDPRGLEAAAVAAYFGERHGHGHGHGRMDPDHDGDGAFGVRRPLRFLAFKLELDDKQVAELARVLNDLKTERAQAAVDHRRSIAGFADLISGETFDEPKVSAVAGGRVKSAERLQDAVVKALGRIHGVLSAEQREKFAYLIRTGALVI
jgi:Spy/CpxP family protein refolding chaperone